MVADALWQALRPHVVILLRDALDSRAADDGDADAALSAHDQARVDAATERFRQRSKQPARSRRASGPTREAKRSRCTARPMQPGGEE